MRTVAIPRKARTWQAGRSVEYSRSFRRLVSGEPDRRDESVNSNAATAGTEAACGPHPFEARAALSPSTS